MLKYQSDKSIFMLAENSLHSIFFKKKKKNYIYIYKKKLYIFILYFLVTNNTLHPNCLFH